MATIKDVARAVGLSITTVSRALNGYDDVAETTRARILEAARALDYHPNAVARSLQGNRANAIGLVFPLVLHRSYDTFWLEFIGGMAATCSARGVDLLVSATDGRSEVGQGFKRLARGRRVDGLVICDVLRHDPRITYLRERTIPFVAFGRTAEPEGYSFIDVDGQAGVQQAIGHLLDLGHRRIAYLGLDLDFGFSYHRFRGYRSALRTAGLPCEQALVYHGLTEADVPAVIDALLALQPPPTALFAAADFLALAAMKAVRAAGLEIPTDLSLAVFDDSPLVQHAEPPLTAVSQPNRRLGEETAALLLDRLTNPTAPPVQHLITPTLIVRQSTIAPSSSDEGIAQAGQANQALDTAVWPDADRR
jgi:LacI family transcriptional regulator